MDTKGKLWFVAWALIVLGYIGSVIYQRNNPKVDLPEEYKSITPNDTLKGYYDSDGVLHIEFNNQRNK